MITENELFFNIKGAINKALNEGRTQKYTVFDAINAADGCETYQDFMNKDPEMFKYAQQKKWLPLLHLQGRTNVTHVGNVRNGKGRPRKSSKLSNLYMRTDAGDTHQVERYIKAWVNTYFKKVQRTFYMDNIADVDEFRRVILDSIEKFLSKNRQGSEDQLVDDYVYYAHLYNVEDLDSFQNDIQANFSEIAKIDYNFPLQYVKLHTPVKVVRHRRNGMDSQQLAEIQDYFKKYGKGIDLDECPEETIEELRKYKLRVDGFVWDVCRPTGNENDRSEANAPRLLYKIEELTNTKMMNTIRLCYKYQCMEDYNCNVDYMYVSAIHLDKYLLQEEL